MQVEINPNTYLHIIVARSARGSVAHRGRSQEGTRRRPESRREEAWLREHFAGVPEGRQAPRGLSAGSRQGWGCERLDRRKKTATAMSASPRQSRARATSGLRRRRSRTWLIDLDSRPAQRQTKRESGLAPPAAIS